MPNVPLGHKYNDEIVNIGVDTVTGEIATTGGPLASGNPVVHPSHPAAQKAMQDNKTGPYSDRADNTLPPEGTDPVVPDKPEKPELPNKPELPPKPELPSKPEEPVKPEPPTVPEPKSEPVAVVPGPAVTGTPTT